MDEFKITLKEKVTIITNEAKHFIMRIDKARKLSENDTGVILEATLYMEHTTFVPECSYVFEAVDKDYNSMLGFVDTELFYDCVNFFFHSILNTTYFIKSIPKCSILYCKPVTIFENVNDIQVSNLYNLLSEY